MHLSHFGAEAALILLLCYLMFWFSKSDLLVPIFLLTNSALLIFIFLITGTCVIYQEWLFKVVDVTECITLFIADDRHWQFRENSFTDDQMSQSAVCDS